ncbi:GNAT family N-acetyltransferase [Salinarimonas sp.]|uniref:GNAT family N-acetyltransferase n=1 Tax=Salinarimonas sp. TaxID=2766526 RepID=UPI0032D9AC89
MTNRPASLVSPTDGDVFDLRRPRSAGRLSAGALAACRARGVPLAYDPVQQGWVAQACLDDIDDAPAPDGRPGAPRTPPRASIARERLVLRPWSLDDVPAFVALLDDPRVWQHLPEDYPAPLSEAIARDLIEISNAGAHHEVRAIERDGVAVGQVRLAFDPDARPATQAEISYWLGAPHWGKGIGSEVVALYTNLVFARRPELSAIHAVVHPENRMSARVLEKAGYRREEPPPDDCGVLRYRIRRADRAP